MDWKSRAWRMLYPYPMLIAGSIFVIYVTAAFYLQARAMYAVNPVSSQSIPTSSEAHAVELRGQTIRVDIADTEAKREQGLGGRVGLAGDEGMLFIFDHDDEYPFWMKDMHFPIDIIWISSQRSIVDIAPWVTPDSYPHSFAPQAPARYVLELPAGYAQAHGVQIGDTVGF
jgi:uncharacterized membrane protein (UPF0127 family)